MSLPALPWALRHRDKSQLLQRRASAEERSLSCPGDGEILRNLSSPGATNPTKRFQGVLHTLNQGKILPLSPPGSVWDLPHPSKEIPEIGRVPGTGFSWEKQPVLMAAPPKLLVPGLPAVCQAVPGDLSGKTTALGKGREGRGSDNRGSVRAGQLRAGSFPRSLTRGWDGFPGNLGEISPGKAKFLSLGVNPRHSCSH